MVWPHCEVPPPRGVIAHAFFPRNLNRPIGFLYRTRRDHADRHDLVVRGVGGVAAAAESVEQDLAGQVRFEAALQAGVNRFTHSRGAFTA